MYDENGRLKIHIRAKGMNPLEKDFYVEVGKSELKVELRKNSLKVNGQEIDTAGYYAKIIADQMAWNSGDGRTPAGYCDYAFTIASRVGNPSYATNYVVRVESEDDDNHLFG